MKKRNILFIFLFLILITLTGSVLASGNKVDLYYFYGQGCPHCARLSAFFESIEDNYPNLQINKYEVYFNDENRQLFQDMASSFNTEIRGVPTVFIDSKVIAGFNNAIGESIENEIKRCSDQICEDPINKVDADVTQITGDTSPTEDPEKTKLKQTLTIPAVISAAAVDAINPCAFAVLIILLTSIIISKSKKRALFAGLAFSAAIFISYFLMGLGLYSAVQAIEIGHTVLIIVAILAILIGLFNLKDYLWYGKWFKMEVPDAWRPRMKALLRSVTSVWGAFLIGFVISLFLLPCTSGPYIIILGLLAETTTRASAIPYLLLYNIIFILPMLIITFGIFFGVTTTEKAEEWRTRKLRILHLIAGFILLLLGIGMIIALSLGVI